MSKQVADKNLATNAVENELAITEECSWSNYDNSDFYENINIADMQELAAIGGLSTGCDIEKLKPYWSKAKSILEVGAGYGRVIQSLLNNNFSGKITAIERSNILFQNLQQHYGDNVALLHNDIHNCQNIDDTFDIVLFLWSGIADFLPIEQQHIINNLAKLLNNGGKLILDTMPDKTTPLGMEKSKIQRVYKQIHNDCVVYTYSISIEEIDSYAQSAGLTNVRHIPYMTDTGRARLLHILS